MADVHDKETRSYNMSRIRSKDTKPELLVRKYLFSKGFRYRLHDKSLPGKPDLVLPRLKTTIFVHGCFWHNHSGCKFAAMPKTRREWWKKKLERTKERDQRAFDELRSMGFSVYEVFECELRGKAKEQRLVSLAKEIDGKQSHLH